MITRRKGHAQIIKQLNTNMKAPAVVIEAFKRNTDLKTAFQVLGSVFDNNKDAEIYRKSVRALKTNTWLRSECAEQLGETSTAEIKD